LIAESEIAAAIRSLLNARAPTASICPSDAARYLASRPSRWRALMPAIRDAAAALARDGEIRITRGKEELAPDAITGGPIRLRRGAKWRG